MTVSLPEWYLKGAIGNVCTNRRENGMRRTTIKDVAALAGVSPATVSRTLDDRPEISAETKERVRPPAPSWDTCPTPPPRG